MLRYEERRGFRYLLPALRAVSAHPGVEIVLFGAHRYEEEDFPHIITPGVLSRDGVARLLSTAHIVVDPSLFQGFGLVGLEAMASGAACVLTDSGGVMEYARHDDNALVVPPGDERALAGGDPAPGRGAPAARTAGRGRPRHRPPLHLAQERRDLRRLPARVARGSSRFRQPSAPRSSSTGSCATVTAPRSKAWPARWRSRGRLSRRFALRPSGRRPSPIGA
jgi:hypothetical protein